MTDARRVPAFLLASGGNLIAYLLAQAIGPELVYPHHAAQAVADQVTFLQSCAADNPETGEARTATGSRPRSGERARRERTDKLLASRTLPPFGALAVDEDLIARMERR